MEVVTAAFKAIGALNHRLEGLERRLDRSLLPRCLWGHSAAAENARSLFARLATTNHPLQIVGDAGTGRREAARALHAASARKGRDLIAISCAGPAGRRLKLDLFGCMAGAHPDVAKHRIGWLELARGSTILIDDAEVMDLEVQRQLVDAVEAGRFWRLGGEGAIDLDVRFIAIARTDLRAAPEGTVDPRFAAWIGCFTMSLPPLSERLDDLSALIDETLRLVQSRSRGRRKSLDPSAFRALAAHSWPGNLRELTSALEQAVLASSAEVITVEHLPPLAYEKGQKTGSASPFRSEKDWLLNGLRRNRFRRGKTAEYLGVSRKTLYNKMRAYGLLPKQGETANGGRE
jgi:DNA-binding NtrC family response regulator